MPKESIIKHYSSSTTGNVPSSGDLVEGELAINTADEKVFFKNLGGSVVDISQSKGISGTYARLASSVSSLNGLTGARTLTGDGGAIVGVGNDRVVARLATTTATGAASFSSTNFDVSGAGVVSVKTGGISNTNLVSSTISGVSLGSNLNALTIGTGLGGSSYNGSAAVTITNNGVLSINSQTGAATLTGDGGAIVGVGNNTIRARLADTSATGVASFNSTYFSVSSGAVSLASAYQATGDTVITVPGSGIAVSTSGKTDTLFNIGVTGIVVGGATLTGNVSLTAGSNITLTPSGSTITIASTASGGGGVTTTAANTWTATQTFSGGINVSAGATFSGSIESNGYRIGSGAINAQTTGYSLVAGDNGKVITINSASAVNLTVGTAVGTTGFSCSVIQLGAGQVTIVASSTTLNSYNGLKIAGQHGAASIVCYATNVFNVAGNLTT